ncbi:MAG: sigma 54-interacting transcriptional regulator [Clostridia bacterium]|nr:sigma 54-interacting transcriptional regulator [Clostridia bacterium]
MVADNLILGPSYSLENAIHGVYIADASAKTIGVDQGFERLTATGKEEVLGRFTFDLEEEGYIDKSVTTLVLRHRRLITISQRWLHTGKKVTITGNPVFNSRGEIVLVTTTFYPPDIYPQNPERQELIQGCLPTLEGVVAISPAMQEVLMRAARVANLDTTVLLLGETGVGKEVVAKFIHQVSPRRSRNFLKVNLGAVPKELFESELFGYQPGAFTGASRTGKKGFVQAADGGTLFLDEISEIPPSVQVKLLGVLQEKDLIPVGGVNSEKVDVRFIAATNRDLKKLVSQGLFREDLYYRLNVVPIYIPPLRERREDILALTQHFLASFGRRHQLEKHLDFQALDVLMEYQWPGNVRELQNLIERLVVVYPQKTITKGMVLAELAELQQERHQKPELIIEASDYRGAVAQTEKCLMIHALQNHTSLEEAAQALGMHRTTLLRKMRKYGIKPKVG